MPVRSGRYTAPVAASTAEGWTLRRLTPPSLLFGANGVCTGPDGRIYVAQTAGSQVSAIDVDIGAIETISPMGGAIIGPDDLVFDDEGNLYCTELTENRVSMLAPDGSSRVIEASLPAANPITWHQGRLIAGECRVGGRIVELDRSGGAPRLIIDEVPMPNAFQVGPDGKLYFPVMGANEIWRVNLAGGLPEVVARDLGVPGSLKFHPDGYIVSTQVESGQVLKIDPRSGDKRVLADLPAGLDNVTFVGRRIFVSHITGSIHEILEPGKVRTLVGQGLQWPLGLAVGPEQEICIADSGFAYTLRPGGTLQLAGMLFTPGFPRFMRGVAAAATGDWLVTTASGEVARFSPVRQESAVLARGFDRLMGVALAADGSVMFAEAATGRVLGAKEGRVAAVASGLATPMGVAAGAHGTLYVSEAGAGRVVRLSGGKAQIVIDGLRQPQGIALAGGRLYVLDVLAKELIECELATGVRRVIAMQLPVGPPHGVVPKPLRGLGTICGPLDSFAGIAVAADGTVYVAGDAEGSVLALCPVPARH